MKSPDLTLKIELKLIQLIKSNEENALAEHTAVSSENYLTLAKLYQFNEQFKREVKILERFIQFPQSRKHDLDMVTSLLNNANNRLKQQQIALESQLKSESKIRSDTNSAQKETVSDSNPTEVNTNDSSQKRVFLTQSGAQDQLIIEPSLLEGNPTVSKKATEKPFELIRLVAICGGYTGKNIDDELFELSLVSFDYCKNNDAIMRIGDVYHGRRLPLTQIPPKQRLRFGVNSEQLKSLTLDKKKICDVIGNAQCIISHNDPRVERQHLCTLYPELRDVVWRSSQSNINWLKLGFTSRSLTTLLKRYQISLQIKTTLDRAKAITRLMGQNTPESKDTVLKLLLESAPLEALQWNSELKQQSKRLNKKRVSKILSLGFSS